MPVASSSYVPYSTNLNLRPDGDESRSLRFLNRSPVPGRLVAGGSADAVSGYRWAAHARSVPHLCHNHPLTGHNDGRSRTARLAADLAIVRSVQVARRSSN